MDLSQFSQMDPNILVGIVNEQLRLECESLAAFAGCFDVEPSRLCHHLHNAGYEYNVNSNQFITRNY